MAVASIKKEILEELDDLNAEEQRRLLEYARKLPHSKIKGISGTSLLSALSSSGEISKEDLELMEKAIEEGCETVDLNGW